VIDRYVSPEELRRLLSTLLAVVGAIILFALFASIVVPGLRNANRPRAAAPVAPPQGETGWLDPTEYPPARGYDVPPVDPATVLTASPPLLERGLALYRQNCLPCHGERGGGDGPSSAGLRPPPRDFTRPEGWKNGATLGGVFRTLEEGIPGSSMPPFDTLSKKDRMALCHYVQSLGRFPRATEDPATMESLARLFASAGERVPNRIPVSLAIRKLVEESRPTPPLAAGGEGGPGAALVERLVIDRERASRVLAVAPSWRDGAGALARLVAPGAPGNGFSASTLTLGAGEWEALYDELLRAAAGPAGGPATAAAAGPAAGVTGSER